MSAQPVFSPMAGLDLDRVLDLERSIYRFPWTRGNFADSLASGYSAWVARAGAELAGYAVMLLVSDEAQLLNISIAPVRQRTGLGSSLFKHLCGIAAAGGSRRLFLEVRRSNAAALAFYRQHGLRQIGERRGYYPSIEGREDAIVMDLLL